MNPRISSRRVGGALIVRSQIAALIALVALARPGVAEEKASHQVSPFYGSFSYGIPIAVPPIRDATIDAAGELARNSGFIRAERDLLRSRGWTYDPGTTMWYPPTGR